MQKRQGKAGKPGCLWRFDDESNGLLVNGQMVTIQFDVRVRLECGNDPFEILFEDTKQLVVVDIAGGDQQEFVRFAVDQMGIAKVCIFRYNNPLLGQENLVDDRIRRAIAKGRSRV